MPARHPRERSCDRFAAAQCCACAHYTRRTCIRPTDLESAATHASRLDAGARRRSWASVMLPAVMRACSLQTRWETCRSTPWSARGGSIQREPYVLTEIRNTEHAHTDARTHRIRSALARASYLVWALVVGFCGKLRDEKIVQKLLKLGGIHGFVRLQEALHSLCKHTNRSGPKQESSGLDACVRSCSSLSLFHLCGSREAGFVSHVG